MKSVLLGLQLSHAMHFVSVKDIPCLAFTMSQRSQKYAEALPLVLHRRVICRMCEPRGKIGQRAHLSRTLEETGH